MDEIEVVLLKNIKHEMFEDESHFHYYIKTEMTNEKLHEADMINKGKIKNDQESLTECKSDYSKDEDGNIYDKDRSLQDNKECTPFHLQVYKEEPDISADFTSTTFGSTSTETVSTTAFSLTTTTNVTSIYTTSTTRTHYSSETQNPKPENPKTQNPKEQNPKAQNPKTHPIKTPKRPSSVIFTPNGTKLYTCAECDFMSENKAKMSTHRKGHKGKEYCEICQSSFSAQTITKHMKRHENNTFKRTVKDLTFQLKFDDKGNKLYACKHCDFNSSVYSKYRSHLVTHKPRVYCKICENYYTTASIYEHRKKHQKGHVQFKATYATRFDLNGKMLYCCKECDFISDSNKKYKKHHQSHKPKIFCDICQKHINNRSFNSHLKIHVIGLKKFRCKVCEFEGQSKEILRDHAIDKHIIKLEVLKCEACEYQTDDKIKFYTHQESHAKKNETCKECGKVVRKAYISNHMKMHENKTITCSVCKMVCTFQSYKNHKLHHVEEENTCPICGKKFTIKGKFAVHLRLHRDKRDRRRKKHPLPIDNLDVST